MTRIGLAFMLTGVALFVTPSPAQTFVSYRCADGAMISAVFFKGERRMHMQLEGSSLVLPQRLSGSGARYAKSGVSFWIKGQGARLKRPKKKATLCQVQ